jgi:hypothetical protein
MGDSEKDSDSAEETPVEPPDQNDYELPDPDTQVLEEGDEPGDLKKTDE